MEMEAERRWHLRRGRYLGEVSALCFLHLPPPTAGSGKLPLPLLLAGTGSEILVYDLAAGAEDTLLASFQTFEGTRVHGVALNHNFPPPLDSTPLLAFQLAVFGERRVKLFNLHFRTPGISSPYHLQEPASCFNLELALLHSLPKFSHWVLDVCFLNKNGATSSNQRGFWLAVGCSDNSVWFWDILTHDVISQVKCADRCLLYSMRMWGSDVESLLVASGTIYNEVIVWKLDIQNRSPVLRSPAEDQTNSTVGEDVHICGQQYQAVHICRLTGHEGSIFRIAWLSDGSKLMSVSDDRSARIWVVNNRGGSFSSAQDDVHDFVGPVLFGHSARVWDCCIFDDLIITAGEDCTCRVWGLDGTQLKIIKEHVGRGVWRCLYDPISSLIVTAGFDSAIKVHQMHATSYKSSKRCTWSKEDLMDRKEAFTFLVPNSSGHTGLMDSKSEYVRCLHFSREDFLYVATNKGYLHHLQFDTGQVKWTELVRGDEGVPIICMDLLSKGFDISGGIEDWVAVGDGKGRMMIVQVVGNIWNPKVERTLMWSAEIERQLLGTYWCKSLGFRFIFTADPRGTLKLWKLCDSLAPVSQSIERSDDACLIATYVSCFDTRIMCLDASSEFEMLVCGDIRGNILLFPLSRSILFGKSFSSEAKTPPLSYFKGAHGISSVCSISIASSGLSQVEICSTGQDGCICYLEHSKIWRSLEFTGMKTVKELSAIRSVFRSGHCNNDLEDQNYAIGFASSDFIIWNLTAETKVAKIACGGWRRPHSYYVGNVPETNNCFAFVKNEIIYIHRHWVPDSKSELYPQNVHVQFHGREIHSVCFIAGESDYSLDKKHRMLPKSDWIATGCEDGTVRLTRYEPGSKNWSTSKLLGEHVGGSAVRSICCVSKIYTIVLNLTYMPGEVLRVNGTVEDPENPLLLISVGAKRVITAWKRKFSARNKRETMCGGPGTRDGNGFHDSSSSAVSPTILFQWLSTDMPTKDINDERRQNTENETDDTGMAHVTTCKIVTTDDLDFSKNGKKILKACLADKCENDWRYLAVTAFLVKVTDSRISVCFVVVASSDATVTLRALLLPCQLWFDVAMLGSMSSPVLALQHVIVPKHLGLEDNLLVGSVYMVISGSTDGSIAFWDLSKDVEDFMQQVSLLRIKDYIDCQRRPPTGRGSQGGRRWRTIGNVMKKTPGNEHERKSHFHKGKNDNVALSIRTKKKYDKDVQNDADHATSEMPYSKQHTHACPQLRDYTSVSEEKADEPSIGIHKIEPLHISYNVHQSGVNCLYVSDIKDIGFSGNKSTYCVLSGGDDQALNCLRFDLTLKSVSQTCQNSYAEVHSNTLAETTNDTIHTFEIQNHLMKIFSLQKVTSAHSSAVKGVWTDGNWVFSTGLDQRVRCWNLDWHGKLIERTHLVVSVPEPEALDAQACGSQHYQITVAGRGIQMIEFFASS